MCRLAGWIDLGAKGVLESADSAPVDVSENGKMALFHLIVANCKDSELNDYAKNATTVLRSNDKSLASGNSLHLHLLEPRNHYEIKGALSRRNI